MDWKIKFSFGSAMATLLLVGVISYRSMVNSAASEQWVQHTHEVIENTQACSIALKDLESGNRMFVLTGDESVLESARGDESRLAEHTAAIRRLTVDNPLQKQRLPQLAMLITNRVQFARDVAAVRRGEGLDAALALVRNEKGIRIMSQFDALIGTMEEEETRLLAERSQRARDSQVETDRALVAAFALGSLISFGTAWRVRRESVLRAGAERAMAMSEEKFRGLLEAAPDAMVVVDVSGNVALVNRQTEKLFGYPRDTLLGMEVKALLTSGYPGLNPCSDVVEQEVDGTDLIGKTIECEGLREDGRAFPIDLVMSPMHGLEGRLVTCAIRDVSERKVTERRLAETVEELKRSNTELQQFAHVASHDLQEPLRMVTSYTQLLAKRYRGKLGADADEFIEYAVDGCSRMKGLIEDLLSLSRFGTRKKVVSRVSVDQPLSEALVALRALIEESGAKVTRDPMPDVATDGQQLLQVFQNLIGNAIKYRSEEMPRIHVSAVLEGGKEWVFSVRDNGLGIDPAYFDRIFVMFERLHGLQHFSGNGIGLAICKKIVERLGGRIWVESEVQKGSTFFFSLPAAVSEVSSAPAA